MPNMRFNKTLFTLLAITLASPVLSGVAKDKSQSHSVASHLEKIVIAHRGASGYQPQHSLASKQLAFEMGADYIEQDLVLTKDDRLIVLHDVYLEKVTDVAERYKNRARSDGHYYAIDFTWDEIATLERKSLRKGVFKVHLFEQELALIQKLNRITGQDVGIYPEIKNPSFHRHEGKDISRKVLKVLAKHGYTKRSSKVYLQSFDASELQRIRYTLLDEYQMDIKLVQLIAQTRWGITSVYSEQGVINYQYDWMLKAGAMEQIAQYAQGIGPYKEMLIKNSASADKLQISHLAKEAHSANLVVHPYTFRRNERRKANYASSLEEQLEIFYFKVGVDGVFTDFPDVAVDLLKSKAVNKP